MATYTVHKGIGDNRVVIALDGFGPADNDVQGGYTKVGSFDHGETDEGDNTTSPQSLNKDGEHFLIAGAKQVLRDSEDYKHLNLDALTYLDQASNAPQHDGIVYSTEALLDSGGEPHPDISTQLGGVGSKANDSQIEHGGADGNEDGSENRQEGQAEGEQDPLDHDNDGRKGGSLPHTSENGDETVEQLKERVSKITDKDELQKVLDDEKAGKNRSTAVAAIEARQAELNDSE